MYCKHQKTDENLTLERQWWFRHWHERRSNAPVNANFASPDLTIGCGVAIFHVATERVVLCYHSRDRYWFLPKGRRDVGEDTARAAEREGFEESGYRNRLLPLPIRHRQPRAHAPDASAVARSAFATEPVWTQLIPQSAHTQYVLFWYIAETVPPDVEEAVAYVAPSQYPPGLNISERIKMDDGYEPVRHANTGVDEEEALYESYLLPAAEAMSKVRGTIMADVIRKGWEGIRARQAWETAQQTENGS
ncbi:hypothetical protein K490DRAFT_70817 [Saccharata proteae CBS 121410]|uniref:Nudix hydrolase domain-containing protein n=1 Tax=Saccharata proteae CBS 121410 TaxID=1314787 RepID=A0A9P4M0D1_9PEZI|nr:hypothetical protein K490DRAFT_70817 [Saccharata proteae CBS 121410]